ncbi:beta-ketoacyl synthase N-terminal-like domain-containing protein [Arenibaculum sp.]|jgi:3-oxoacyl-(acyl-carrier-protein) synthase|uniref:beta-ketoacyl synthase N-terminal-like domain-containing protein n=1 Tax=Arenibaculum sp. TaxID=2865862 RepID=UPI002E138311|nr:beta-ketoacyl synthase N-terminal-like domain-containing protein [Arenibaculum sp.]
MRSLAAITGIGVLSPAGAGEEALWRGLTGGEDRRGSWPKRVLSGYPIDNVVPIPEDLWKTTSASAAHPGNRAASLADFAVGQALAQAGLPDRAGLRVGCILSSTTAGVEAAEDDVLGLRPVPTPSDLDGSVIVPTGARRWTGPTGVISTACSSGLVAPALAIDALAAGEADAMVAGGLDVLLEYTICGFNALRLAAGDRCRPFAQGRRGVVLSEGVACFCLEPLEAALRRGARIRAIVTGYGMSCDADHVTAPNPAGVARAVAAALETGGTAPGAIGGIFAHATGTQANDATEVAALRTVFGTGGLPPITAVKSVMGHPQAGAGAMSLLAAVLALENSWLPPTAGLDELDPALGGIDIVTGSGRALDKRTLMVNAFGFGGNNCVMTVADLDGVAGHRAGGA